MQTSKIALRFIGVVLLLATFGCGSGGSGLPGGSPSPGPGTPRPDGAIDPAQGDLMYSQVLRSASGVPSGIKLNWTSLPGLTYNVYKSNATIPDTARGGATLVSGLPADNYIDVFTDQPTPPQIGSNWFYRISAVDADGDESRLSPELQVDVTLHVALAVDTDAATAGDQDTTTPGQQVTITGQNFGVYNSVTDKVLCAGSTWTGVAPGGFDTTTLLDAPIVSWDETVIVATLPADFITGQLGVSITGQGVASSPLVRNSAPYITAMNPLAGTAATMVTLNGNNFGTAAATTTLKIGSLTGTIKTISNTLLRFDPAPTHTFGLLPVQVNHNALDSNTGFLDQSNAPPTPSLTVADITGFGKLLTTLDASGSTDVEDDTDGNPATNLTYDFDLNSSPGTFELTGVTNKELATFLVGTNTVTVRVTDSDGASTTFAPGIAITVATSLAGDWPMFGANAAHTRLSAFNGPQASAFPRRKYATQGGVYSNPVFAADGTVYVGDSSAVGGVLWAFNLDGTTKWKFPAAGTTAAILRTAAIGGDGTIYFVSSGNVLFAVNADGTFKWSRNFTQPLSDLTVGTTGLLYLSSLDRNVYALRDIGTGAQVSWQRPCAAGAPFAPSVGDDGSVYVPCLDGRLYAFRADGTPKWIHDPDLAKADPLLASCLIAPTTPPTIYFGTGAGDLYAITDGGAAPNLKWTTSLNVGGGWNTSPAAGPDGTVYIGNSMGVLFAVIDTGPAGAIKAQFPPAPGVTSNFTSPAIGADGKVYVSNEDDFVYCLDPATLAMIWQFDTGADIFSSPAIGPDGALYVGYDTNGLHAFGISNQRPPTATIFIGAGNTSQDIGVNNFLTFNVNAVSPENIPVTSYDYDFDTDGVSDTVSTLNSESFNYTTPGSYTAEVKVTDENGEVNVVSATVGPVRVWSVENIAPAAQYVRIDDTTGMPACAYIVNNGALPHDIMFQRATAGPGGPQWPPVPMTLYSSAGLTLSQEVFDMAIAPDGSAGIVFAEGNLLRFLYSPDFGGTWTGPFNISVLGVLGYTDASIIWNFNRPAVAYVMNLAGSSGVVCYSRALANDGANWLPAPNHVALASSGVSCDLAMVNGHPALAYAGVGPSTLQSVMYKRSTTADGDLTTDWPGNPVEAIIGTGLEECALAEVMDPNTAIPLAAVAITRVQTQDEIFYLLGDADWSLPPSATVIHANSFGPGLDLAFVDGLPCTAWGESPTASDTFKFFKAQNSDGSTWLAGNAVPLVNPVINSGQSVSIAELAPLGGPNTAAVAFTTATNQLFICLQP